MRKGGVGGAKTQTGLHFERRIALSDALRRKAGYYIVANDVVYHGKPVGRLVGKGKLYTHLLEPRGVDWKTIISRRLLPDEALLVESTRTLYVIEMKFQETEGSVDEKLQTCDFKKRQYAKLVAPLGLTCEYIYMLGRWFEKPRYRDVLEYVREVGCDYFFEEIPLARLGLPVPTP